MQLSEFQENQSTEFDLKELLLKYLAFFHWFVFGLLISFTTAFFYLRYTNNVYQSSSVIKILDNNNSGFKMPTDAMSFFSKGKINLENEMEVLKSSLLIERVVDTLDLQNNYYTEGSFKSKDISHNSPFTIHWTSDFQRTNELELDFFIKLTRKGFFLEDSEELKHFGKIYSIKGHSFFITLNSLKSNKVFGDFKIVKISRDHAVNYIKSKLSVATVGEESELLKISVTDFSPEKAANIVNMLAILFDQDGINDRKRVHQKTVSFVNERFGFLFRELDSIEKNKANYKQKEVLADFRSDAGALLATKSGTKNELNATKTQAILSEILIETLGKVKANELLPANIGLEQVEVATIIDQYNELVLKQQKLLQSVGENHPAVLEIKDTQKELKNNIKVSLATYKKVLQSKIAAITQISSGQSQQYAALPFQEKAIRSIERQQEIKETLYVILLEKREEAAVNLAIINPSIKIVEPAKPFYSAIEPKSQIVYLIALVLGIGIPFGLIYLYFLMDTKIHTKKEVESVINEIPIIAEIPHITSDVKLVKYLDRSVLSESFRMLRTNLNYLMTDTKKAQVIFTTSIIKGEGKTFVSINLAITLSTLGKKVILVGADLRNPQLHKFLNIPRNQKGVTNYMHNSQTQLEDIIENGSKYNLNCDFIFSGAIPPNPAELLSNGRFELLLEELKKQYDYVLVDTAPTLLVTDTTLITNLADLIVFVVRANFTDKKLLHFVNELHIMKKIKNVGIVLNNVGEQKGYGYKYGYGYSYSYKYNYGYGYGYGADETKRIRKRSVWQKIKKRIKL